MATPGEDTKEGKRESGISGRWGARDDEKLKEQERDPFNDLRRET